ncbi:response regulator [Streptomyces niveiscabiei]|uniref:response regulator n=1 Tax=Streptomyces niveiscabiei TaxID=164115 RepID=UPI0006EB3E66|nr:response regulator transcription factor [Streptomyces niveiscabiei]
MSEPTENSRPLRVIVADDQATVREPLAAVLDLADDIDVVAAAADGTGVLAAVAAGPVDVILMDLRMPGGGGVEAIGRLTRTGARAKVLVLTTYDTDSDTLPAIEAGATGYLLKDAPRDELFTAVRAAADGRTVLSPAVATRLVTAVRTPASEPLSAREREVLALVAKGTSNREIARELFISEATVKTHLTHLYAKLGVSDRAAAVAVAYERKILG